MSRIMVIDDSEAIRTGMTRLLSLHGHTAIPAAGGSEALSKVKSARPDLVLLDLSLPDMDGLQFLERLAQEQPGMGAVPVIVFSAVDNNQVRWRASQLGVVEYITKGPVGWDEMVVRIERHLAATGVPPR
jgi:two-component system, chemotaxis family, chemotaxis protein CheY